MIKSSRTWYLLSCDFCGKEFEVEGEPVKTGFSFDTVKTVNGLPEKKHEVASEGHMCPECISLLKLMKAHRETVEATVEAVEKGGKGKC